MMNFLKLVRFPNLLIIALTQYLIRWCLLFSLFSFNGVEFQMSEFDFFLLVLSTVLIAAAGYTINDYFDTRIDRVNKPGKILIDIHVKRRVAMGAHVTMNGIAIIIGFYLAYQQRKMNLAGIQILSAALLWYYSTTLKKKLIVGNIVVAILAAMVPLIPAIYEIPMIVSAYRPVFLENVTHFYSFFYFVGVYALFAFLITMAREIVKDIEDYEGDVQYGCNTIPVAFGLRTAAYIAAAFAFLTIILVAYIQYIQWTQKDYLSFAWFLIFVQAPLVLFLIRVVKADEKSNFSFLSLLLKITMVAGILSMVIFYFTFR